MSHIDDFYDDDGHHIGTLAEGKLFDSASRQIGTVKGGVLYNMGGELIGPLLAEKGRLAQQHLLKGKQEIPV